MAIKASPSLRIFHSNPKASRRLFCFPFSGASAQAYKDWDQLLPDDVELVAIQLPGRAGRFRDPLFTQLPVAVESLYQEMKPFLDKPFSFFGHSLGAALAFELARNLKADNIHPQLLIVSGWHGPHLPALEPSLYHLPEPEFKQRLKDFNGTPKEVLEHEELMDLCLPILRADFTMADTYEYKPGVVLDCPLLALGGEDDPHTGGASAMAAWSEHSIGECQHEIFPGDHFFIHQYEARVLARISQGLREARGT